MQQVLQANIIKIYLLVFFQAAMLVTPIFVPLLQGHGLSMTEIMQTQALFALTIALCEVPAGYLADQWGRRNTLVLGTLTCATGFGWLCVSESFIDFLIYEFIFGTGVALCSGADLALLYDSQNKLNTLRNSNGGNHIARLVSLEGLAGAAAAIGAGLLTAVSLESLLLVQAVIAIVPVLLSLRLVEVPGKISVSSHRESASMIKQEVVGNPLVL